MDPFQDDVTNESCTNILQVYTVNVAFLQDNLNVRYRVSKLTHLAIFLAPKSQRRHFENDSAFLAAVGFLKMTRVFEKADQLLAMSRGNVIMGLTFSHHSSSILGSFHDKMLTMATETPISGSTNLPHTAVTDDSKSKKSDAVSGGQCCACKWPECRKWDRAFCWS